VEIIVVIMRNIVASKIEKKCDVVRKITTGPNSKSPETKTFLKVENVVNGE
jgi:hypothetical protein